MKLIDNGNWGNETVYGKRRGHNNSRKQESNGEDIIGLHVHDNDKDDNGTESGTIKHVMATVGSTGMEHQNAYELIRNEEEFDDKSIR